MRFSLTDEQRGFARAIDDLLTGADVPGANRAWATGDADPGLRLWGKLSDLGLTSLADPSSGAEASDLVVAFEQLGRHVVPGPYLEGGVLVPALLGETPEGMTTAAVPLALDADVAVTTYAVRDDELGTVSVGDRIESIDPSRRLFAVDGFDAIRPVEDAVAAHDLATLAAAAQLVGAGYRVLEDTVSYAAARQQFGRPIGSQQAVKHQLADARVGLDFARPLVWGAALSLTSRDVSAAKVAAGDAAYAASRAALQVHGAIGYTAEFDLSLWLLRIRALRSAWGTPSYHRGRVLDALMAGTS